ncbi:class I SAM-dependent methyltransferase [Psittacicella hinzii]|uniref:class I SAM-dependent methyltransferase n=1 Tax=Psittacicella hinzii TaxID=2028575 RepID=UPI001CA79021|nr:class I SAM-dependent methyltransferase [Psittacicella hinzii]
MLGTNTLSLDLSFFNKSLSIEVETTKNNFFEQINKVISNSELNNLFDLYKTSFEQFNRYSKRLENFVNSQGLSQANVFPEPSEVEYNLFRFIETFNYAVTNEIEVAFKKIKHDAQAPLALVYYQGKLSIAYKNKNGELSKTKNPVSVDFLEGETATRAKNLNNVRSEFVVRSVISKRLPVGQQYILDATAGFGQDSFLLTTAGANVLMLERNPVIGLLLADGLNRLKNQSPEQVNLNLRFPVSITTNAGKNICKSLNFTSVYLDPMYPHKESSAKVNKKMQSIQEIVGLDHDTDDLFRAAQSLNASRIVVKRPKNAPFLGNKETNDSVKSPSHRFDLYYLGKKESTLFPKILNGFVAKDLLEKVKNLKVSPAQNQVTYENLLACRKVINFINLRQESLFGERGKYHSIVCAYSGLLGTDTLVARRIDFDTYKKYRDQMINNLNFEVPGDNEYRLQSFLKSPEFAEQASKALSELEKKSKSKPKTKAKAKSSRK